jgi:hypothetical protein
MLAFNVWASNHCPVLVFKLGGVGFRVVDLVIPEIQVPQEAAKAKGELFFQIRKGH